MSLAIDQQTRGLRIIGLTEDAARCYPKSLKQAAQLLEAEFSVPVQKDVWHILDKAGQTLRDLERLALKRPEKAEDEHQAALKAQVDDACLAAWVEAEEAADVPLEMSHQFRFWYGCLCDALELVDWRSDEIRDRAINQWLLDETLEGLRQLDHPRVKKLVTTLENQYAELLPLRQAQGRLFLDWLEAQLIPWQQRLADAFSDPADQALFQSTVARAWRLNRALVNGHPQFQALADDAQTWLSELIADNPPARRLADWTTKNAMKDRGGGRRSAVGSQLTLRSAVAGVAE